jgi:hypothetical protein
MKYANWIPALMLLFVPLIAVAQMKPTERIVTQVPFKYMVGDTAMPAGECTVLLANENNSVLLVGSTVARHWVYAPTTPNLGKKASDAALTFHRYGDQYFLTEVRVGNSRSIYTFRPTKLEKELRAQSVSETEEILLASSK